MTDDGRQVAKGIVTAAVIADPSIGRQRAAVVAEARSWIGTPYHNCADIKGAGVDCGMLLVRVFVDTGLIPRFDPRPYPVDWHLHRDAERYLGFVLDFGFGETKTPQPGDIVVLRYGRCYSHGGIVTRAQPLSIVHAFHPARRVLEEETALNAVLNDPKRQRRFFSYWAIPRITGASGLQARGDAREDAHVGASTYRTGASGLQARGDAREDAHVGTSTGAKK